MVRIKLFIPGRNIHVDLWYNQTRSYKCQMLYCTHKQTNLEYSLMLVTDWYDIYEGYLG